MDERNLERDGFCLLKQGVTQCTVARLLSVCRDTFEGDSDGIRARSSRGHVYAARNSIDSIPEVTTVWQPAAQNLILGFQVADLAGQFLVS